jgi:hypothetical protein
MRKNRVLFGALGVAGVLAVTGSAFTATSGFSNATDDDRTFGAVEQVIEGYNIKSVDYDLDPENDEFEGVTVVVDEVVDAADLMRIGFDLTALESEDEANYVDGTCAVPDLVANAGDSTYVCTFGANSNVTSVYYLIGN